MWLSWFLTASAEPAPAPVAAEVPPTAVVAMGDGLVAGRPSAAEEPTVSGGWVPVLADCLAERAPKRFSVVDRAVPAETLQSARARVDVVRDLGPSYVVVAIGSQELAAPTVDLPALRSGLDRLVTELLGKPKKARPTILLLSTVPPTLAQLPEPGGPELQIGIDERTAAWNEVLAEVSKANDGVSHVNVLADWPTAGEQRAGLTAKAWSLSDQGHARVAAAVCDALLAAQRGAQR